jgi:hypothetical protein
MKKGIASLFSRLRPPNPQPEPQQQQAPKLTSLSDSQIELLSDFMKERFDGFASGKLYVFDGITPPHPEQFLWFEIGLLLGLLTGDLESDADAEAYWNRIVPPLIMQASPDLTPERMQAIATVARAYRDTWIKHYLADDAPLAEILSFTIGAAFGCDDQDHEYRHKIIQLTAGKILDDSGEFLSRCRGIVHRHEPA